MNSQFAVAVHILTLLEKAGGSPVSSERMAGSINTNASLVRRLLGVLAAAGLTTSQMGTGGGAFLARPAATITLFDVYQAVQTGELFGQPNEAANPVCPVGRHVQAALVTHLARGEQALAHELAQTSIADILHAVVAREAEHIRAAADRAAS